MGSTLLKVETINAIRAAGKQVKHVIHRHGLTEDEAKLVEAVLIDAFPRLTNIQGGYASSEYGPMTADQLVFEYGLPELTEEDLKHRVVLINVNSYQNPFTQLGDQSFKIDQQQRNLLDQVRFAWKIDVKRAKQADYVLAVWRGIVLGAYIAEEWLPATQENFGKDFAEEFPTDEDWVKRIKRNGFKGSEAPESIWKHYVGELGKRIVAEGAKHNQNPIRYWEPKG